MGYYVSVNNENKIKYQAIDNTAFKNFLAFANHLQFKKLMFIGNDLCHVTYYDNPNHLLNKAGVVVSRFEEGSNIFFRVENTTFLSKLLKNKKVFVHKVGPNDTIYDHGFYVKEGITSLTSGSFSVDIENVIKTSAPTIDIITKAKIYDIISGTGMRVNIALEDKKIINHETHRKYKVQHMIVKLDSKSSVYQEEFNVFNQLIQKNCKSLMIIEDNNFDYAVKVTKPIVKVAPKKDDKKDKNNKNSKNNKNNKKQ